MKRTACIMTISVCLAGMAAPVFAQTQPPLPTLPGPDDPTRIMVGRLELEKYKATIKGLTQFGDRRQGTERNRKAVDWVEAQLKRYGCTNTERIIYQYTPPPPNPNAGQRATSPFGPSGARIRGNRIPDVVNNDPNKQPDLRLRELNMEPTQPGRREEVYCTKIGTTHPEEMYIVGAPMDGLGPGEAANDGGTGNAEVTGIARVFSRPDVKTGRAIRPTLPNNGAS